MANKETLEKNFISAVIYLNSAENKQELSEFLDKVLDNLQEHFLQFELICVDDASPAEYLKCVKDCKSKYEQVSVAILHMSHYQGMEVAMNAGRDLAIGDFVMEFDECCYNFDDSMIERVYAECLKDFDIVCCADKTKNKKSSQVFYGLFNRFSGMEYKLQSDNFRIISRRGINRIQSLNRTIPYRKALYANCGLKMKVLEYEPIRKCSYRYDKKAKKNRRTLAVDSLLLFTDVGYRIAAWMAGLMAAVMVFSAIYALVIYLSGIAIVGWTTTVLFLSFAFFGLFVILSIVIKYLSLLLNLTFKRQRYLFSGIEKL
ncbi:MAG: glycosyltransferase [Lachnospiraceae bacterium]|nr:glycosyltransferase [Lachnospiraceae bacterium]